LKKANKKASKIRQGSKKIKGISKWSRSKKQIYSGISFRKFRENRKNSRENRKNCRFVMSKREIQGLKKEFFRLKKNSEIHQLPDENGTQKLSMKREDKKKIGGQLSRIMKKRQHMTRIKKFRDKLKKSK